MPDAPGVSIARLEPGLKLDEALAQGKVDATMVPPRGAKKLSETTRSPYADVAEAQRAFYSATGIFPIMHFVVVRNSVAAELPWLAGALETAFSKSKRLAEERGALPPILPGLPAGTDPWAFGIPANERALDAFLGFSRAHAWVSPTLGVRDCFVGG